MNGEIFFSKMFETLEMLSKPYRGDMSYEEFMTIAGMGCGKTMQGADYIDKFLSERREK